MHPAAEAKRKEWAGIEPLCVTTVPQSSVLVRAKSGSLWLTSPPAVAVASPVYTIPPLPQRTERYLSLTHCRRSATRAPNDTRRGPECRHGRPRVIPLDDLMRDAIISETGLQVSATKTHRINRQGNAPRWYNTAMPPVLATARLLQFFLPVTAGPVNAMARTQVECDITVVKTYSKSAAMCTDDELPSTPAAR